MKKNLFGWLAMATMLVGIGCSSDEVVNDYSPENAIQFGTYVGRDAQSRAASIDGSILESKGFGVFAYYTGTDNFGNGSPLNYMRNQEVRFTNSVWTYSPIKYWPNNENDKISFFAYAPYWNASTSAINISGIPASDATGNPLITFKVPTEVTDQVDLLYANQPNLKKQDVNENIKFVFQHALARVGFKVEAMIDVKNGDGDGTADDNDSHEASKEKDGATTIIVESVTLSGKFFSKGDLNLVSGNWANLTTEQQSYTLDSDNFSNISTGVTTSKTQLNNDNSYLMLIPKSFASGGETMTVKVVYTVKTKDDNLKGGYSTISNTITSEPFNLAEGLTKGRAYNLCLHLGLTSVKLSAEVTAWDPTAGTDYVVNVPINTTTTPPTNP